MRDSKRDTDVQNSILDSVGEGEGGMIWENGIKTCIISYKKQIVSLGSMQDTRCWGWCTGMTQGTVWGGKWEGVQDGEHVYAMADSC